MGKVKAPRPTPRIVKVAPSEAQLEVRRSLRWQQANTAAREFLAAAKDAHESLIVFSPITKQHVDWLKEAISDAIEYLDELDRFETHYEMDKFYIDNKFDQAESIASLLRGMTCHNDNGLGFECPDIPDESRRNISELIDSKMEFVARSGWSMYHVFVGGM